jgi:hypothetical protein
LCSIHSPKEQKKNNSFKHNNNNLHQWIITII